MIEVRHPYIVPPLVIPVEADRLDEFTEAGWLLHEEPTTDDPATGPDSPKEEK